MCNHTFRADVASGVAATQSAPAVRPPSFCAHHLDLNAAIISRYFRRHELMAAALASDAGPLPVNTVLIIFNKV